MDPPTATPESTFSHALLASLKHQRSTLLSNGQKPLCDVILRCGGIATQGHASVLAAVSKYFERILTERSQSTNQLHSLTTPIVSSSLVSIDVSRLFRGIETLFPIIIDSLYNGVRVVSPQAPINQLLNSAYNQLELQLPFSIPEIEIEQQVVVTTDCHSTTNDIPENKKTTLDNNEENISMDLSICPQCNMLFVSKEEFLAHSKVKCAKRLTCYTCGQFFTRVQGLANHLVDVRHGEMVCSICGFEGESQKDAEIHIAKHAADMDKPYFCTFCDLRFSTRKRWEKHLPKHSNEAPFVCKDCGKAFKWNHALTAHSVVHAPHKKFLCQECGFSTSHVSTFRFHNRMHTGNLMKCDVKSCTFQTTRKSNLVQHKLTHSKEKPHQCEICGQSFSLAKNMRRHARQHDTNATIFRCKVNNCSFKSLRSDKYIEHVKKYHPTTSPSSPNSISNNHPIVEEKATANIDEVNHHVNQIKTETKLTVIKSEQKSSLLTTSPFNTVSPPNKTVSDTYDNATSAAGAGAPTPSVTAASVIMDDGQFDDALILAAAAASEEDITNLVTPLLS